MSTKILVPDLSESVSEATVGRWLKSEGDSVQQGEALVALETDKIDLEVGAEAAGVLGKVERREGETVASGDVLGVIEEGAAEAASEVRESPAAPQKPARREDERAPEDGKHRVTPVARRIAEERGVDLSGVEGTGPNGRVVKEDVERRAEPEAEADLPREEPKTEERERQTRPPEPRAEATDEERPEERRRLSTRRRTIARRLVEARQQTAMLTTFNDVDMGAVLDLRKRYGADFEERHGVRLGITSFFVKASVSALAAFPELNSELEGDVLVLKRYYDVGIAVSDPGGLVVPVVRDCRRKSLAQIEREIDDLAKRARSGRLGVEELQGGTFTVTNGGIFGSLLSTPILNPPQVGILGLHRIEPRPVGRNGSIELRPMMYIALSYDHRVVDGAEAVQFLDHVKRLVERPETFVLES